MKTKKPATHTGTVIYAPPGPGAIKYIPVQLVEHKATYENKATGQKFAKATGSVRPYSAWSRIYLDVGSVRPLSEPTNGS